MIKTLLSGLWDAIPPLIKWPALIIGLPFVSTILLIWFLWVLPMLTGTINSAIVVSEMRLNDKLSYNQGVRNAEIKGINTSVEDIRSSVRRIEQQNSIMYQHMLNMKNP